MHASVILSQDSLEYAPLFAEIADAYFDREMYAEAGHIYEMLGADASVSANTSSPTTSINSLIDEQPSSTPASCVLSPYGRRFEGSCRSI